MNSIQSMQCVFNDHQRHSENSIEILIETIEAIYYYCNEIFVPYIVIQVAIFRRIHTPSSNYKVN